MLGSEVPPCWTITFGAGHGCSGPGVPLGEGVRSATGGVEPEAAGLAEAAVPQLATFFVRRRRFGGRGLRLRRSRSVLRRRGGPLSFGFRGARRCICWL